LLLVVRGYTYRAHKANFRRPFFEEVINRRESPAGWGQHRCRKRFLDDSRPHMHGVETAGRSASSKTGRHGLRGQRMSSCPKDHIDFRSRHSRVLSPRTRASRGRVNHDRLDLTAQTPPSFRSARRCNITWCLSTSSRKIAMVPTAECSTPTLTSDRHSPAHYQRRWKPTARVAQASEFGECVIFYPLLALLPLRQNRTFPGPPSNVKQEAQHIVVIVAWLVTSARIAAVRRCCLSRHRAKMPRASGRVARKKWHVHQTHHARASFFGDRDQNAKYSPTDARRSA